MAVVHHGDPGLIISHSSEIVTDRFGLSTGNCSFTVLPGRWDLIPQLNSVHPFASFLLMEQRKVITARGFWTIVGEYAGGENDESAPEYELEIGTGSEPIETHPRFVSDIAGTPANPRNGAVFVDDTGHPTSDNAVGVFDRFRATIGGGRNRKAGMTHFNAANNTMWVKSWTSRSRIVGGGTVGKISAPEGGAPSFGDGRNWIYAGLNSRKRGGAYSHRKLWQLSGPGGWDPDVYG